MVKINYSWYAEMLNTGTHADNDTERVCETVWYAEKKGQEESDLGLFQGSSTITSNRLIIDLEERWGVFQFNFVHINILIE